MREHVTEILSAPLGAPTPSALFDAQQAADKESFQEDMKVDPPPPTAAEVHRCLENLSAQRRHRGELEAERDSKGAALARAIEAHAAIEAQMQELYSAEAELYYDAAMDGIDFAAVELPRSDLERRYAILAGDVRPKDASTARPRRHGVIRRLSDETSALEAEIKRFVAEDLAEAEGTFLVAWSAQIADVFYRKAAEAALYADGGIVSPYNGRAGRIREEGMRLKSDAHKARSEREEAERRKRIEQQQGK